MGDSGETGLYNGERVRKDSKIFSVLGDFDELTSILGVVKSKLINESISKEIEKVQKNLMLIMANIAGKKECKISEKDITEIEELIDSYQSMVPKRKSFVIPGYCETSALIDVARTVTRRAERSLVSLENEIYVDGDFKKYINRLSDYLYIAARFIEFKENVAQKVIEVLNINNNVLKKINLKIAKEIIEYVEKKAIEMNVPVVIAIADENAIIKAVHNMDGALIASYDIAVNKAYTAAALRCSTEELGELSKEGSPLYGIQNTNNKIVVFGGGCPLKIGNRFLGSIGVSGGTAKEDIELANYGANILKEVLK